MIDKKILQRILDNINLIIISAVGRGGSYFFQSLINMHPEIVILSERTRFHFNDYQNIDEFIKKNKSSFDHREAYFNSIEISNQIESNLDIKEFHKNYLNLVRLKKPNNKKEEFIFYYLSYALLMGYDINSVKYIALHVHNPAAERKLYYEYLKDFPSMKVSILTKDLKLTYESVAKIFIKKHNIFNDDMLIFRIEKNLLEYQTLFKLYKVISTNLKIIDINQLHEDGQKHMRQYAIWLGIKYNHSMLESKIGKTVWHGNRSDGKKSTGLDREFYRIHNESDSILTANQKKLINKHFKCIMGGFGHKPFNISTDETANKKKFRVKNNGFYLFRAESTGRKNIKYYIKYFLKYDFFRYKFVQIFMDKDKLSDLDRLYETFEFKDDSFLCQS